MHAANAAAKLNRVCAFLNLGEVLQLPSAGSVNRVANGRPTADKRTAYVQCRYSGVPQTLRAVARKLKTRFVDRRGIQYSCFRYLENLGS